MSLYAFFTGKKTQERKATSPLYSEPHFFKKSSREDVTAAPPPPLSDHPARLFPSTPEPRLNAISVKGTTRPLLRKEIYADPTLASYLTASFLAHFVIIFALTYNASQRHMVGNPQAQNQSPVEMIFAQPPATSGMVGPQSPTAGGGNQAPTQSSTTTPPKEALPEPTSAAASSPQPSAQSQETSQNGEVPPQETPPSPTPTPQQQTHKQKPQPTKVPQNLAAMLNHPQDYSLNQSTAPPRPSKARPGGSNAPIDLSVGPIVQNGKINAQYSSHLQVKGVSSDYAAQINAWIQKHLYYPPEAAEHGDQGDSTVHVTLDRSGKVLKVFEIQSSNSDTLDASTISMFDHAKLPPVPEDMKDQFINFNVTVNYILLQN